MSDNQYEYNNPDPMAPARGALIGFALGAAIWFLIYLAFKYGCPAFMWYIAQWGKICA